MHFAWIQQTFSDNLFGRLLAVPQLNYIFNVHKYFFQFRILEKHIQTIIEGKNVNMN